MECADYLSGDLAGGAEPLRCRKPGLHEQLAIIRGFNVLAQKFDLPIATITGGQKAGDDFREGDVSRSQTAAVLFTVGGLPGVAKLHQGDFLHDFDRQVRYAILAEMVGIESES